MNDAYAFCIDLVRNRDRDLYLCALLSPSRHKRALFALFALNCEIAEIGPSVSEPIIGQMRLRWWLDSLALIYDGNPPQHPVAVALSDLISKRDLPQAVVERLIEAHEFDMGEPSELTMAALKTYAQGTASTLIELALAAIGLDHQTGAQTANHLGIAWSLTKVARTLPQQVQKRRLLLPVDLHENPKLDRQSLLDHGYRGAAPEGLCETVQELRSVIVNELDLARKDWAEGPRPFASPLLLATLIEGHLSELSGAGNDPFQIAPQRTTPRVRQLLRMKWASMVRKF